jgi:hypothetical protein
MTGIRVELWNRGARHDIGNRPPFWPSGVSSTTEVPQPNFLTLRERIRHYGALYNSAPLLLDALETIMNEAIPKANRFLLHMLPPEKRAIYDNCLTIIAKARGSHDQPAQNRRTTQRRTALR